MTLHHHRWQTPQNPVTFVHGGRELRWPRWMRRSNQIIQMPVGFCESPRRDLTQGAEMKLLPIIMGVVIVPKLAYADIDLPPCNATSVGVEQIASNDHLRGTRQNWIRDPGGNPIVNFANGLATSAYLLTGSGANVLLKCEKAPPGLFAPRQAAFFWKVCSPRVMAQQHVVAGETCDNAPDPTK